jgi:hypothetical protein
MGYNVGYEYAQHERMFRKMHACIDGTLGEFSS